MKALYDAAAFLGVEITNIKRREGGGYSFTINNGERIIVYQPEPEAMGLDWWLSSRPCVHNQFDLGLTTTLLQKFLNLERPSRQP